MLTFRRIATRAAFDAFWHLLAPAVGSTGPARREALRALYLEDAGCTLCAVYEGADAVGVLGWRLAPDSRQGEIRHVSVAQARRGQGVGRAILLGLAERLPEVEEWVAETDDEAVGFYVAVGFRATDLGERYPGVRRYLCRWRPVPLRP